MNSSTSNGSAATGPRPPVRDAWWRKRKQYISDKPMQVRLVGQAATILLLGAVMALGNLYVFDELSSVFEASTAPGDLGTRLLVGIYGGLSVTVSVSIILIITLFYSHRVAGPASKLCRHLEQIRSGATGNVDLRNSDLLAGLAAEINQTQRHWRRSADAALEAVADLRRGDGSADEATIAARCRTIELALDPYRGRATAPSQPVGPKHP